MGEWAVRSVVISERSIEMLFLIVFFLLYFFLINSAYFQNYKTIWLKRNFIEITANLNSIQKWTVSDQLYNMFDIFE